MGIWIARESACKALDVANPMQWLVYQAETAISERVNAEETQALARLAVGLGSQSNAILDYGVQSGFVEAKDADAGANEDAGSGVGPAAQTAALDSAEKAPAALPTVAVIPLEPTAEVTPDGPAEESGAGSASEPLPTSTQEPVSVELAPTATVISVPRVVASTSMNVRSGPGTAYPIVDAIGSGEGADIVAKNAQSDWWQVKLTGDQLGWVFGQLVETSGDVQAIAVAADIPEPPPPTPTLEAVAPPESPAAEPPPARRGPSIRRRSASAAERRAGFPCD